MHVKKILILMNFTILLVTNSTFSLDNLKILDARYGICNKIQDYNMKRRGVRGCVDVTEIVKNSIGEKATNNILGEDPAPYIKKNVYITYLDGNQQKQETLIREGSILAMPEGPSTLLTARYGICDKCLDFTPQIQEYIGHTIADFHIAFSIDPAPYIVKTLAITYIDLLGQIRTAYFNDGSQAVLSVQNIEPHIYRQLLEEIQRQQGANPRRQVLLELEQVLLQRQNAKRQQDADQEPGSQDAEQEPGSQDADQEPGSQDIEQEPGSSERIRIKEPRRLR